MNILDENTSESQRILLRKSCVPVRQIGLDIRRIGMKDDEIIPLLQQADRPTFFTLDVDFYDFRLCHEKYCLAHLDVEEDLVAEYVRRLLRHRAPNSKAKRMGRVIQVMPGGLGIYALPSEKRGPPFVA